jgi:dTDP-4-dehydrorhamnose 3,5-epimerase
VRYEVIQGLTGRGHTTRDRAAIRGIARMLTKPSLLDTTLAAAVKDGQTVSKDGKSLRRLTEGVLLRDLPVHADDRGSVMEMFDPRWNWHPDPIVFTYCFTIRPGYVKGWNLHKLHEDRYCLLQGEMELVLYDPRPESTTCGEVCKIVLTANQRRIVNVPRNVWHADHNIGSTDLLVVNFPTTAYDHADPDKYRLPIDSDLIPHKFPGARGY